MLSYPPFSRGPLPWVLANKAFLEHPKQQLSPKTNFTSSANGTCEIWRFEKCSIMCPLTAAHCFNFPKVKQFWEAPNNSSYQNFIVGHFLTLGQRSAGSKSALLCASVQGPTVLVSCK